MGFGMTGFILTVLGIAIAVMWPLNKQLHANIMMGEPALAFGVLLAGASFFLWSRHELFDDLGEGNEKSQQAIAYIGAVLRPVSAWVFATGLMMASLTVAILYYQLGHAPPQEPISGRFSGSWVEPDFLGSVWGFDRDRRATVSSRRYERESQGAASCRDVLERRRCSVRAL